MNVTNAAVLTGVIVVAGHWAQDKQLNVRIAIGTGGLAIGLAIMNDSAPDLASKFATLIVIAAVFLYGPAIVKKAGLVK